MAIGSKQQGMTLVELLVSTVILAGLISISTFSFSFFSNYWNKTERKLNGNFTNGIKLVEIKRVVSATIPFGIRENLNEYGFFFIGNQKELIAVSQVSIFGSDSPTVYRLSLNELNQGWVLKYEESQLSRFMPHTALDVPDNFDSVIEIEFDGELPSFDYLGWPPSVGSSVEGLSIVNDYDIKKTKWLEIYNGSKSVSIPSAIKVTFIDEGNSIEFMMRTSDMLPESLFSFGTE